jgi:hypothetical protein
MIGVHPNPTNTETEMMMMMMMMCVNLPTWADFETIEEIIYHFICNTNRMSSERNKSILDTN